jgi:phage-related minor tail protein
MYKTNDFCEDCYKNRLKNETIKAEAEKKTEKERKDAKKKAEKERKEAEKKTEKERKDAEKKAEKERKEAVKKTEKERKDAKKKKVEEEKKERVENKKMEAEEEYTIKLEAEKIKLHIDKPNKIIIPGFIYALSNGSIPNMIKIGFTKKNPTVRAKELSGTGLPTPYKVERFVEVHDKKKEKKVHKLLENMGHRVNTKREFFNVSMETINLIFNLIDECA